MIKTSGIDSLTNFQKHVKEFATRLEESGEPLVLTVNGKAKLVVQNADAYQAMLDELERSRVVDAIGQPYKNEPQCKRPGEIAFAETKVEPDAIEQSEKSMFIGAIRQGLKEADQGLGRSADVVCAEMKVKYVKHA